MEMQTIVKPWLDGHLHFAYLYYTTLWASVKSFEGGAKWGFLRI